MSQPYICSDNHWSKESGFHLILSYYALMMEKWFITFKDEKVFFLLDAMHLMKYVRKIEKSD